MWGSLALVLVSGFPDPDSPDKKSAANQFEESNGVQKQTLKRKFTGCFGLLIKVMVWWNKNLKSTSLQVFNGDLKSS